MKRKDTHWTDGAKLSFIHPKLKEELLQIWRSVFGTDKFLIQLNFNLFAADVKQLADGCCVPIGRGNDDFIIYEKVYGMYVAFWIDW